MLSINHDNACEWVQMIRCFRCDACRIADLVRVFSLDLAGIYLHLAQYETTQPVLTIIFFVSQVHLGRLQTGNLSPLFDASSDQLEEPLATDAKYDKCQDDCEVAPTDGICNCGQYSHFFFVDNDDYLPYVAFVDA